MALVLANAAAVARAAGVQAPGEQCNAGCWLADRESGRQQCGSRLCLWLSQHSHLLRRACFFSHQQQIKKGSVFAIFGGADWKAVVQGKRVHELPGTVPGALNRGVLDILAVPKAARKSCGQEATSTWFW